MAEVIAERAAQVDPAPVSPGELVAAQVRALDSWAAAARLRDAAVASRVAVSEERLHVLERQQIRRVEHDALLARADRLLDDAAATLPRTLGWRAVHAHREDWLREHVSSALAAREVHVLASVDNGAEAVAALVCEQPELLLVGEELLGVSGLEVLLRARQFSPHTVLAVHGDGQQQAGPLRELGVQAWFPRRTPPREIAAHLTALLSRTLVAFQPAH